MTTLTIELPDRLVDEARDAGLLSSEAIETMLRERLRECGIDELLGAAERLAATPDEPMMSLEQIQREVDAVRAERRTVAGHLTPRETPLRERRRKRGVDELFEMADRLAAVDLPPMSEEDVQAEVDAVRAERRRASP